MKIIFIQNYQGKRVPDKVYGCSYTLYSTPDLATLYNAAVLKKAGHDVTLCKIKEKVSLPPADIYLINSVILSFETDMLIAQKIKNKKTFFFGPYPTLYPEKYLKFQNYFVLRGETEHYIAQAILKPKATLGVSYKTNKTVYHNKTAGIIKNLDSVPFPARELDNERYFNPKLNLKKFTNVLASRGCANRCYFCVPNSISWARELEWKKYHKEKPPVKIRSTKNVIEELKLIKQQGYDEFSFIDDQFVVGKERTIEIAKAIKKLGLKYGILARADRLLDADVTEDLSNSGCKYVDIGAESFNQDILDDIKKDIKVETILEAIRLLSKYKIEPKINIMLGTSSKESKAIIEDTVKKTLSLPSNYCMFSIATPFPGTEFRKVAEKKNWIIKNDDINPASVAQISYPELSNKDLEQITKNANLRFYLRPKVFFVVFKKALSPKSAKLYTKLLLNWLRNFKK
ncbi:MAG: B12-binding domain-containing radical SAM protein [Patescibacteria group bacterium]|nr:B12-binding domain-containing radical SAM protein [Patescibacteria group bacterium]